MQTAAWSMPAQVLILRHAEKIEESNHLSAAGYERARRLVGFFNANIRTHVFGQPVVIYSSYKPGTSLRSVETMMPTAQALGLKMIKNYFKKDTKDMVREILNEPAYDGKTVIICWQHTNIINILHDFGSDFIPADWPGSVFDQVMVLNENHGRYHYKVIPQLLLPGDQTKVPELTL